MYTFISCFFWLKTAHFWSDVNHFFSIYFHLQSNAAQNMAEGHKRHWPKTRETFKLSNQKTVRDIFRERAKNSSSRPHSDLSNHNILLKKGKDRRQRVKSRTSPNEFSSSICRHTYHQRLHKTSKQKMELFFDANKIFVPSNATKAPLTWHQLFYL